MLPPLLPHCTSGPCVHIAGWCTGSLAADDTATTHSNSCPLLPCDTAGTSINFSAQGPLPAAAPAAVAPAVAPAAAVGSKAAAPATVLPGMHEVTLSATGIKHGAGKKVTAIKARSRLCPAALLESFCRLHDACGLQGACECCQQASALQASGAAGPGTSSAAPSAAAAAPAAAQGEAWRLGQAAAKERYGAAYLAAWRALQQPPSVLAAWLRKPPDLRGFTACSGAEG